MWWSFWAPFPCWGRRSSYCRGCAASRSAPRPRSSFFASLSVISCVRRPDCLRCGCWVWLCLWLCGCARVHHGACPLPPSATAKAPTRCAHAWPRTQSAVVVAQAAGSLRSATRVMCECVAWYGVVATPAPSHRSCPACVSSLQTKSDCLADISCACVVVDAAAC